LIAGTLSVGNAAEAAVLAAFVERGYAVFIPFGDGHPYDLAVDLAPGLLRIQCKAARTEPRILKFNSCSTDHGRGRLPYAGRADVFGVYSAVTGRVYLVPVAGSPEFAISLRLEPTRNRQHARIRYAADYEIDRWSPELLRVLLRGHVTAASPGQPRLAA
jgi:hypothetical protein